MDATRARADAVGDALVRHCPQGFSETAGGRPGHRLLRAYLPFGAEGRDRLRRLRRALSGLPGRPRVRTRLLREADWAAAWRARARPIRVDGVLILPTRLPPARRGRAGNVGTAASGGRRGIRAVIRLDPGMAFGSGEHASTRLCLAAIARHLRPGGLVIDLGTGSGILAIAAARLGARRVLAIDNDPVAVAAARANVRRNRVTRRVTVRRRDGLAGLRLRADLIVANLTAEILPAVAGAMPACLAPGGRVVVSGFGSPRAGDVRRCLQAAGLRAVGAERWRGWCAIHALRR